MEIIGYGQIADRKAIMKLSAQANRGEALQEKLNAVEEKLLTFDKSFVIGLGSACGVDLSEYNIEKKEQYRCEIRSKFQINNNPRNAYKVRLPARTLYTKGGYLSAFKC